MRIFLSLLFLISSFVFNTKGYAQESTWEIGGGLGVAGYMGDLNIHNPFQVSGLAGNVFAKKNFNGIFGLRFSLGTGQISASDTESDNLNHVERNLNFKTNLNEAAAIFEFNLFDFNAGGEFGKVFTPYIFTGLAAVNFNPKAEYNGVKYDLRSNNTEGNSENYKNIALSIPYGVGIKYNFKDAWSVFTEIGYRTAFTDYLDDVSGRYPENPSIVRNGSSYVNLSDPSVNQIGIGGLQRGDFRKRDTYLFVSVGISFNFVNSKCFSL